MAKKIEVVKTSKNVFFSIATRDSRPLKDGALTDESLQLEVVNTSMGGPRGALAVVNRRPPDPDTLSSAGDIHYQFYFFFITLSFY